MQEKSLCLAAIVSKYHTVLSHALDQLPPTKIQTITIHPDAPWYNDEIAVEKRLRRRLERKWRRSHLECDRLHYMYQCGVVNQLIRKSKVKYYSTLIQENAHDSRVLFKTVNRLLQKNLEIPIQLPTIIETLQIHSQTFSPPKSSASVVK